MSNELHYVVQIWISDIEIDEKYYKFKYHVALNGQAHKTGDISDSHSRRDDIDDFKRSLEGGWALLQVCQRLEFSY